MPVSFFRKLAPIAATVTLSSGLLIAGAGVASADEASQQLVFDSPSSLTVTRDDLGELEVVYDNQSGQFMLMCGVTLSTVEVVDAMIDHLKTIDPEDSETAEPPAHIQALVDEATEAGRYSSVLLAAMGPGPTQPSSQIEMGDADFAPAGVAICQGGIQGNEGWVKNGYYEVEVFGTEPTEPAEPAVPAPTPVFDSPSVLGLHRDPITGGYYFSYDNQSGRDLYCTVHVETEERTAARLAHLKTAELTMDDVLELPRVGDEYHRAGWFAVHAGTSGPAKAVMVPGPMSEDFAPQAVTLCVDVELNGREFVSFPGEHLEIEHAVLTVEGDDDNGSPQQPGGLLEQILDVIDVFGSLD